MNDDYLESDKIIISVDLLYENAKKEISDSNYTNAIELLTSCLNISSEYIYKVHYFEYVYLFCFH